MPPLSPRQDSAFGALPQIADIRTAYAGFLARVVAPVGAVVSAAIGAAGRTITQGAAALPAPPPEPRPRHVRSGTNAARVLARRSLVHPDTGAVWWVSEVTTRGLPGARGDSCLLFDGPGPVRRLWRYPAGWERLADAALFALSEG